ncbi:Predicted oxidoreductase, contains short-chain dehydrogenase (SDR) and DUF2520 domains [Marinitoga hydrogenitolerans DSM 16785]|uniref:Predicted oxidoreductase, contains short-chain dehydrogenase (SDR) and DUF2520 domains n=1 Tax=Marinitoga hydrogenitolerans (strain DSM 16785 / JCM 12826 / AT1271) TaxID=1122195 RepID=A0A1M4VNV3_MARH1|nr:DUF2520 domain-containing protein [Marinitoga hydrogenitolerans]SHE70555.1 Predicted oxidoreductase, contains short-chain dehydrogenase (SDR) and DUF2520 domains [Marinitoga hydrogenitolerans DSM 16785]
MIENNITINIIGPGKVGRSLYNCFKEKHIKTLLIDKNWDYKNKKLNGIVLITTQDENIIPVWNILQKHDLTKILAIGHCSGYLDSSFFDNIPHFSIHPNFPFSSIKKCHEIKNITWGIEGDEIGITFAKEIINILNGKYVIIPQNKKGIYHLAAVIASNFSYVLIKMAKDLYDEIEIKDINHLLDLSINSLNNIKKIGLKNALTGPVARNDFNTINNERDIFGEILGNVEVYDFFIKLLYKIKEDD